MDLPTLFLVYAGTLLAVSASLVIVWRQNPDERGARTWAIGSGWSALALAGFAISAPSPELIWLNAGSNLIAWLGILYYARGIRQFVRLPATPTWMWAYCGVCAAVMCALIAATPYGQGVLIIVGSAVFALFSFDVVQIAFRSPAMRNAPSYFIAFFFGLFACTHSIRGVMTLLDYAQPSYARTIDHVLIFVGILGGAGTAMGTAMLVTQRLLDERAANLKDLVDAVDHLREQFVGLAAGDYRVRAELSDAGAPLDALGTLFNEMVETVENTQSQLQVTDRLTAMGTVAAGVAHEINNPLAFVMANLDFVVEELETLESSDQNTLAADDRTELLRALRAAQDGAERVRRIVKDLKQLSRSSAQDAAGPVEINEIIESSAAMLRNEVRHHASLELDLRSVPRVVAAEAKLGQVFMNLIHNAAQAIPPGHASENHIRVRSFCDERGVIVEVEDSGAGIPEQNRKRIFDAFFTTKPVGVGTGLGLALCHRVVDGLGGTIEVESEVGVGTTFRVILPSTNQEPVPVVESAAGSLTALGRRVLVIDDEVEIGHSARRILGRLHDVDVVASARDGLAKLEEIDYDIILCDLMMPDMTGMELFHKLSTESPALAQRMLFLSGGAFSPEVEEFLESVPERTISKPFSTKSLRKAVSRWAGAGEA